MGGAGGAAGGVSSDGGSGGKGTSGGKTMGGAVGTGGSESRPPTDAGVPVDQAQRSTDAGTAGEAGVSATPCPAETFDHDGLPATPCKPWKNCPPGQYVGAEGTPLKDRTCASCPAASFSVRENAPNCDPWITCDGWDQSEKTAGTSTSDRVCKISDGIRATGTKEDDQGTGIAVDNEGNVVIVGCTNGALAGAALGDYDAFVRKFNPRGEVVWTRQFGTEREDMAMEVAVDGDGGVFVVGYTGGALEGTSTGEADAFVRKYSRDGVVAWTRQFGTADRDRAYAVAVDAKGNVSVAGGTNIASLDQWLFLRTYAPNGDLVRVYDLDLPSSTIAYAAAVDASGSIYLAGSSTGEIEGPRAGGFDAILMKIDAQGHVAWTRQYGTPYTDEAVAVALDRDGNPWVAGYQGAHHVGGSVRAGDGFVRKYDPRGTLSFSYSIQESPWGEVRGVAVDSRQHGFVIGTRTASDPTLSGVTQAYIEELDAEGDLLGPWSLGDPNQDSANGVATSASGRVYVLVNSCYIPFAGHQVVGRCDAFVVQVR